ncbi:MAG: SEC-C metal-binding domain-containing protein [Anaerolineae bacterium]
METQETTWQKLLRMTTEALGPAQFDEEITGLLTELDEEEALAYYVGLVADVMAVTTGLTATLDTSTREEAQAALDQIAAALADVDFQSGQEVLSPQRQELYQRFAQMARPFLSELGRAIAATFGAYVAETDPPETDPNALVLEAEALMEKDRAAAVALLGRAAALGLRGNRWWWRWRDEIAPPLQNPVHLMTMVVDGITVQGQVPLDSPSLERVQWREAGEVVEEEVWAEEEAMTETAAEAEVEDLIDQLFEGEDALPPDLQERITALQEAAIPRLIEIAEDRDLWNEDSPGEGWAPIHAMDVLGKLKAANAVPLLIDIVAETEPMDILYDGALFALEEIGTAALPALLATMRYSRDMTLKTSLAPTLGEVGHRSEEAYQTLLDLYQATTWEEGRDLVVMGLAALGDERAVPSLQEALEDPDLGIYDRNEVIDALERLGVEVPEEEKERWQPPWVEGITRLTQPEELARLLEALPPERRADAERVAYSYVYMVEMALGRGTLEMSFDAPPDLASAIVAFMGLALLGLDFEEDATEFSAEVQRAYEHLAGDAGQTLRQRGDGLMAVLYAYTGGGYSLDDDPNALLSRARDIFDEDEEEARSLLGQAGALALRGKPLWPLWHRELKEPLYDWTIAALDLVASLRQDGQWPLAEFSEEHARRQESPEEAPPAMPTTEAAVTPPETESLSQRLYEGEQALTPDLVEQFHSQRETVVPALRRLLYDWALYDTEGSGEGWVPIHAVRLLGELGAEEAIDDLMEVLAESRYEEIIRQTTLEALEQIGPPALPAALDFLRWSRRTGLQGEVAGLIGVIGKEDERAYPALRTFFEQTDWDGARTLAVSALALLGDQRAIPLLRSALKERDLQPSDVASLAMALGELGVNIEREPALKRAVRRISLHSPEELEPRLMEDDEGQVYRIGQDAQGRPLCPDCGMPMVEEDGRLVHAPQTPVHAEKKVRRNDPCPCGSGKKYKHCCWKKDREKGG